MTKWIVHPHSYKDKNTQISVVKENNEHGLKSFGWFDDNKIFIYTDSMYGITTEEVKSLLRNYAERLADKLNKEEDLQ